MALSEVERRFCLLEGPWRTAYRRDGSVVVYPPGDDIVHLLTGEECPCGPRRDNCPCGMECAPIWVHHSLDGREGQPPPGMAVV